MNSRRFAALKVSQLSPKDKKWILAQLGESEKNLLASELESLRNISKRLAFNKLLDETDVDALEAVFERDSSASISINERHKSVEKLLEQIEPQKLAGVLNNVSSYMVAASSIVHPEIGLKYLTMCKPGRAKEIRALVNSLDKPLPPGFVNNLELVIYDEITRLNKTQALG